MTKSILIIGADRGLGLGLTQQFAARGWSVTGTARPGTDAAELAAIADVAHIDVTDAAGIDPLLGELSNIRFDVVFSNAGIWGAEHQDVTQASDTEFAEVMLTNTFGPVRLAHRLLDRLGPDGTLAFMSSHRGSIAINDEGGLELYRASKVELNMLAHGLWATNRDRGLTVLSIHPGWVNTAMGTLNGTVDYEIELEPSVRGVADVVERHMRTGDHLYRDWLDRPLDW